MSKNSLKISKKNILQERTFMPKLTADDTIAFAFIAAERGLTPDKLIESFIRDIVSSFCADEITVEEEHLLNWFNDSWFSQDNDGYFSFLQYLIRNKCYEEIITKGLNIEFDKNPQTEQLEKILNCYRNYCTENPAHKSFDEEWKNIMDFYNNVDKISKAVNANGFDDNSFSFMALL